MTIHAADCGLADVACPRCVERAADGRPTVAELSARRSLVRAVEFGFEVVFDAADVPSKSVMVGVLDERLGTGVAHVVDAIRRHSMDRRQVTVVVDDRSTAAAVEELEEIFRGLSSRGPSRVSLVEGDS